MDLRADLLTATPEPANCESEFITPRHWDHQDSLAGAADSPGIGIWTHPLRQRFRQTQLTDLSGLAGCGGAFDANSWTDTWDPPAEAANPLQVGARPSGLAA